MLGIVSYFLYQVKFPTLFNGGGYNGSGPSLRPTLIVPHVLFLFYQEWDPVKWTLNRCYSIPKTRVINPNEDDDNCEGGQTRSPIDHPDPPQKDSFTTVPAGSRTTLHHYSI